MQNDRNWWKSFQEALLQSDLDVEVARQRAEQAEMRLEDVREMRLFNFPSPWPAATLFFWQDTAREIPRSKQDLELKLRPSA